MPAPVGIRRAMGSYQVRTRTAGFANSRVKRRVTLGNFANEGSSSATLLRCTEPLAYRPTSNQAKFRSTVIRSPVCSCPSRCSQVCYSQTGLCRLRILVSFNSIFSNCDLPVNLFSPPQKTVG